MLKRQTENTAGGDIFTGDKSTNTSYYFNSPIDSSVLELMELYDRLDSDPEISSCQISFSDELMHYVNARTTGDVRGLEEKLKASGRAYQIEEALELKERAAKLVMKHQMSGTGQRIFTIILDELHTSFNLLVRPAIQEEKLPTDIDRLTYEAIKKTQSLLGRNALKITIKDLHSLIYFLGGNCHIRWDKC